MFHQRRALHSLDGKSHNRTSAVAGCYWTMTAFIERWPIFPRLRAESLTSWIELLLVNSGIQLCRLAVSMLIGCIVALACKRREMLATIAVILVCGFWTVLRDRKDYATLGSFLPVYLLFFSGGLFASLIGGGIVRKCRFRALRPARSDLFVIGNFKSTRRVTVFIFLWCQLDGGGTR